MYCIHIGPTTRLGLTAATYRGSLVTESNFVDFCRQRRLILKPILWLMPHLLRKFWILFNKLHTTNSWRKGQMKVCIAASVSLITAKSLGLMNYHIFSNIQYNFSIINRHFVPKLHSFSDVKTSSFCILRFFGICKQHEKYPGYNVKNSLQSVSSINI